VILGHEIVGRIVAAPPLLRDLLGRELHVGDRVVVASSYYGNCGQCFECNQLKAPWACTHRKAYVASLGGERATVFGGGFSRFVHLTAPDTLLLIKIDAPAEVAVLHEPLSVAAAAIFRGPHVLGADVVVQGTGALGLMAIALTRAAGARQILAVGGPPFRLQLATQLGADAVLDIEDIEDLDGRAGWVRRTSSSGRGADVAYEFAGTASAVSEGLNYLKEGGVLMEAGAAADVGTTSLNPYAELWRDNKRVIAVRGREPRDFTVAAHFLERFPDDLAPLVTHRFPASEIDAAFHALTHGYQFQGEPVVKAVVDMRQPQPSSEKSYRAPA
jgi:threonine dehydrogenase-like Zn-dependent dehydrogenase